MYEAPDVVWWGGGGGGEAQVNKLKRTFRNALRAAGASLIDIDTETKRILLRSRQATQRPSPEPSPTSSRRTSFADDLEEVMYQNLAVGDPGILKVCANLFVHFPKI